jgi:hypothetical protein
VRRDRAEVARRFGLSRARVTQLLNLTLLAPDIQERVLALEAVDGLEPTSERALREVSCAVEWEEQRRWWGDVCWSTDRLVLRKIRSSF